MTCNTNTTDEEVSLRITVLSLEGIQCSSSSSDENNDTSNARSRTIIHANVGFHSSTIPSHSMSIPSSQYSTIGGKEMLAISSESHAQEEKDEKGVVHWHVESVPHLEIALPSLSSSATENKRWNNESEGAIEFHISVVSTPSSQEEEDQSCMESRMDDEDEGEDDSQRMSCRQTQQQQICHGIAHMKLAHSQLGKIADSRRGGKVILLPVVPKSLDRTTQQQQHGGGRQSLPTNGNGIQLAKSAMLSIQIERVMHSSSRSIPTDSRRSEQRHYAESDWDHTGGFAPPSINFNDSHDHGAIHKQKNSAGISQLYRKATSKLTMMTSMSTAVKKQTKPTTNTTTSNTAAAAPLPNTEVKRDEMVGRIVEALEYRCPSEKDNTLPFNLTTSSLETRQTPNDVAPSELLTAGSSTLPPNNSRSGRNGDVKFTNKSILVDDDDDDDDDDDEDNNRERRRMKREGKNK